MLHQNPPQWMLNLGIDANDISRRSSAKENGRVFVIDPDRGDVIWRIKLDGGWLKGDYRKADYLFWGRNSRGQQFIVIVELKGTDYGHALSQIRSTLDKLCKHSATNIVHNELYQGLARHTATSDGGVTAYVILSNSRKVPLKQNEREKIRKEYNVLVHTHSKKCRVRGVKNLR